MQEQQPAATAAVAAANGEHAACGAAASPAPVPADCGEAFSVEQQAAMRLLLLAPSPAAHGGVAQRA